MCLKRCARLRKRLSVVGRHKWVLRRSMNGYARCVSLLARSDSSAVSKRYYTVGTYLFTYWLAEQRSPVLPSGLISLIVESF